MRIFNALSSSRSKIVQAARLQSSKKNVTAATRGFSAVSATKSPVAQHLSKPIFLVVMATGLVVAHHESSSIHQNNKITFNHCQVPCGIFDDPAIVSELQQACTTIRKAIRSSRTLHQTMGNELLSVNQMVRWINTKEEHCQKIIDLVSNYCLCQRVKASAFPNEAEYLQALKLHHNVMQAAMKAKQSMDEQECIALEHAVEDLSKIYTP